MYFNEYILPLWYFSVPLIFLLYSIYYFSYRLLAARKFENRKRIEKRNFKYVFAFIVAAILIYITLSSRNNINIFFGIISIGQGFWTYDYNFILEEGLLIKGKFISWSKISNLDYKDDKTAEISYFKNNQHSKISKMTFKIDYDSKLELEDILKRKRDITNISGWESEDKIHSLNRLKRVLASALIFLTMFFVYGVYNLLQPKSLGIVLENTFNHEQTSTVEVHYPSGVKDENRPTSNVSTTSKEEEITELKNYLNSVHIRKVQFQDIRYKYMFEGFFEITLYKLNGEKVEIFISKEEPTIDIIRDEKKRSYFIEEGYKMQEFINRFVESIN